MNIVITLPQYLIKKIVCGEKTIEVRTKVPRKFDTNRDGVFIVEKGTKTIVAFFKIDKFLLGNMYSDYWKYHGEKMGIEKKWYLTYCDGKKQLCLWFIRNVYKFREPIPLSYLNDVHKAPQSFVYTQQSLRKVLNEVI